MRLTLIKKGETTALPISLNGRSFARQKAPFDLVLISDVHVPLVIAVKDLEAIGFFYRDTIQKRNRKPDQEVIDNKKDFCYSDDDLEYYYW